MPSKREAQLLAEMAIRTAEVRIQRRSYARAAVSAPSPARGGWLLGWAMAGMAVLGLVASL
jgi:hypothetical protein